MRRQDAKQVLWSAQVAGLHAMATGIMLPGQPEGDEQTIIDAWKVVVFGVPCYLDPRLKYALYEDKTAALAAIADTRKEGGS